METAALRREVEPLLIALGKEIRQRRISQGLSQEELAVKSGLHRTYVSDVERGIRNLTMGALWFLAAGLEIPLADMIAHTETRAGDFRPQT